MWCAGYSVACAELLPASTRILRPLRLDALNEPLVDILTQWAAYSGSVDAH